MSRTATEVGAAVLAAFSRANAARQAEKAKCREAIRRLIERRPDLRPKQIPPLVATELGRLPSVRTVQEHLKSLRDTSASR
jgi:hypothetical protein